MRIARDSMARRMGYFALTMAGTWNPTTTPNTQSSSVSHGQSADSPALLAGIRKYASSKADTDSVIRSSRNIPSFQASCRDVGNDGLMGIQPLLDEAEVALGVVQPQTPGLGDRDDVLDPDPEPAGEVDARLHGEAHTR